jgi:transcriptional regulator with XRE-family HTH domain
MVKRALPKVKEKSSSLDPIVVPKPVTAQESPIYGRIKKAFKGASDSYIYKQLRVSKQAFNQWKSGKTKPGLDKLIRISELTGKSVEWLKNGIEPEKAATHNASRQLDPSSLKNTSLIPPRAAIVLSLLRELIRDVVREELSQQEINGNASAVQFNASEDSASTMEAVIASSFILPEGVGIAFKDWDKLSDEEKVEAANQIKEIIEMTEKRATK